MRLYTYNSASKSLTAAPRTVRVDGITYADPTQATLRRAGIDAYPLATDTPPTPPEGKVAIADGYELADGEWHRTYRYEDAPPQPRKRYSVYRLILGLKELGVLAPVVEWVKANNLYEELVTVGVVDGEDADLMAALRDLGASLGVTTEQIDALLAAAEEG